MNSDDPQSREVLEHSRTAQAMMRRQVGLSLKVGALFILIILGLPLFNLYCPELASRSLFGFSLTWFLLGVCFFPLTWLLSSFFVSKSDQIEAEFAGGQGPVSNSGTDIQEDLP